MVMKVSYEEYVSQVVSSFETLSAASKPLESWLLERKLMETGHPVNLLSERYIWRQAASHCQSYHTKREIRTRLANISYLTLSINLHSDVILEKAILQRFLNNNSAQWLDASKRWPILALGDECFQFSSFSSLLYAAFYNVLCLLNSLRTREPRNWRKNILEFLFRANRQMDSLTIGDLLAAHIMLEAVVDLESQFEAALSDVKKRRLIDYVFAGRWRQKVLTAQQMIHWFAETLNKQMSPLRILVDEQMPWDSKWAKLVKGLIVSHARNKSKGAGESIYRWFAWRLAEKIRQLNQQDNGPIEFLNELLNPANETSWEFSAQTMLEVITGVSMYNAERFFKRFHIKSTSILAPVCARITLCVYEKRLSRQKKHLGSLNEIWMRWQRAISELLWLAIKSGDFGQLFVGEFLLHLTREVVTVRLTFVSKNLHELHFLHLCREWFRWSLKESYGHDNEQRKKLLDIRQELIELHPDMRRMFQIQESIWKASLTPK